MANALGKGPSGSEVPAAAAKRRSRLNDLLNEAAPRQNSVLSLYAPVTQCRV